mgnify:CR=1 FL=1
MLPPEVMAEIRSDVPFIAHDRPDACVLFCDIVSFTALCSRISSEVTRNVHSLPNSPAAHNRMWWRF